MKTKTYFFRLIIALIALVIGLGVYRIVERFQQSFEEQETCLHQPQNVIPIATKEETVETKSVQEDSQNYQFYPDDTYYTWDENLPDGFRNLRYLTIETTDWINTKEDNKPQPILPKGELQAGKEYKFNKISINNRLISFETQKINGIHFTFVGTFPEDLVDETDHPIDLKGVLSKYKNGKLVAKHKVDFYVGGC